MLYPTPMTIRTLTGIVPGGSVTCSLRDERFLTSLAQDALIESQHPHNTLEERQFFEALHDAVLDLRENLVLPGETALAPC